MHVKIQTYANLSVMNYAKASTSKNYPLNDVYHTLWAFCYVCVHMYVCVCVCLNGVHVWCMCLNVVYQCLCCLPEGSCMFY